LRNGQFEEGECIETLENSRYHISSGFVTRVHDDDTVEVYLYGEHDLLVVSRSTIRSQGRFVSAEHFHRCIDAAEEARWADPWRR
jgi:hypothetical protein